MSNTGVFGLSGYNDKNLEGLIPDKTREAFREYGYFDRGNTLIDRIDYSNDTATASRVRWIIKFSKKFISGNRKL
jgi:hypothetical protein